MIGNDAFQEFHRRHHPALHQAQLPGQIRRRSGARHPRGFPSPLAAAVPARWSSICLRGRADGPARYTPRDQVSHRTYNSKSIRPPTRSSRSSISWRRRGARSLRRGWSDQRRPRSMRPVDRIAPRASDHPHLNGARRLSGQRSAVHRHARHARHLRGESAMHGCDLMIALGSRFDDRVTGRLDRFSPARGRCTSTSTRRRSTRTFRSTWRWLRMPAEPCRRYSFAGAPRDCSRMPTGWRRGGSRSVCRRPTACATDRTARRSSRSTRSSACTS